MLEKIKYGLEYTLGVMFLALMIGGPFVIALCVEIMKG